MSVNACMTLLHHYIFSVFNEESGNWLQFPYSLFLLVPWSY